jgi:hypothetical protein
MNKTELLALADWLDAITVRRHFHFDEAAAALREYAGTMDAEPVAWEYRWTNPGNQTTQPDEMLEWKPIEHPNGQTLQEKIADLEAYRYDGKPCYEVRKLFTSTPSPQRTPLSDEQIKAIWWYAESQLRGDSPDEWWLIFARAVLTAQDKK